MRRHDRPGPRYTSYPTAPRFHSGFGESDYLQAIADSNEEPLPRDLSLYLHVPFCTSPCFYCGCTRVISRDASKGEAYAERLKQEARLLARRFDRDRPVVQLHFGGGTPSFLGVQGLAEVMDTLSGLWSLSQSEARDFSIELDPRVSDGEMAAALAFMGFNRVSLGVQDFDPAVQRAVNRVQDVEPTLRLIEDCRRQGIASVNVDLIYGLPKQSEAGFANTLQQVLGARPERIAIYAYAHLPEMFRAQRRIHASDLPDAETKLRLFLLAARTLTDAGYVYIGMDHFALPDDPLSRALHSGGLHRNFMGYTTHAHTDLLGLGCSAISQVGDCFAQNERELPRWSASIDQGHLPILRGLRRTEDDRLRAEIIQTLMCRAQLRFDRIGLPEDGPAFAERFASALQAMAPLQADGLVRMDEDGIEVLPAGRPLLKVIARCFDAYDRAEPVPATALPGPPRLAARG